MKYFCCCYCCCCCCYCYCFYFFCLFRQLYYKIIESWCGGLNWKFPFPHSGIWTLGSHLVAMFEEIIGRCSFGGGIIHWLGWRVLNLMLLPLTALFQMWAPRLLFLHFCSLLSRLPVKRTLSPLQLHFQIAALPTSCFWCLLQQKSDQCTGQSAFLRAGKKERILSLPHSLSDDSEQRTVDIHKWWCLPFGPYVFRLTTI